METKEIIKVSEIELIEILKNVNSQTFTNIVTLTKVRMNKTNNPFFDKVIKKTKGNYMIGTDYEKRVQNNDKKEGGEGTFESKESSVGVHVSKCVLFNEKLNRYYLQYEYFEETKPQSVEHIYEGNSIDKQLFESYLVKKSETTRQPQERRVFLQTFKIESIEQISLNGKIYQVER